MPDGRAADQRAYGDEDQKAQRADGRGEQAQGGQEELVFGRNVPGGRHGQEQPQQRGVMEGIVKLHGGGHAPEERQYRQVKFMGQRPLQME